MPASRRPEHNTTGTWAGDVIQAQKDKYPAPPLLPLVRAHAPSPVGLGLGGTHKPSEEELTSHIERGISRDLGRNYVPYDVVTFRPKFGANDATSRVRQPELPQRKSALARRSPASVHHHNPITCEVLPQDDGELPPLPRKKAGLGGANDRRERPPIDVISGAPLTTKGAEIIAQRESESADRLNSALAKRSADPITGARAAGPTAEDAQRSALLAHGYGQLPVILADRTVSSHYNIISGNAYDPDAIRKSDARQTGRLARRSKWREHFQEYSREEMAKAHAHEERRLRRMANYEPRESASPPQRGDPFPLVLEEPTPHAKTFERNTDRYPAHVLPQVPGRRSAAIVATAGINTNRNIFGSASEFSN